MTHEDNIWVVNSATVEYIIENRKPIGLFIYQDKSQYVGIDNRTGDAWTEDFKTKMSCIAWLIGKLSAEEVRDREKSNCDDLRQEVGQHKVLKEFEIAGEVITVREFGYPDYQFRIITGCIPGAYRIWNVPKDTLPKGYVPLCRPSDRQRIPGGMEIDANSLFAVEAEGSDIIMNAIGFGPNSLETMEAYVKKHCGAKPGTYEYGALQRAKKALPYLRKIKWN